MASDTEQIPLRESRVLLLRDDCACGTSFISIAWRRYDVDVDCISRADRPLTKDLDASSRCAVDTDDESLSQFSSLCERVGGHRNGTSCVSRASPHAVRDADCTVPGLPDLIAASSAIFPTSGHAHRTFATAAIKVKLAAHPKALSANSWPAP